MDRNPVNLIDRVIAAGAELRVKAGRLYLSSDPGPVLIQALAACKAEVIAALEQSDMGDPVGYQQFVSQNVTVMERYGYFSGLTGAASFAVSPELDGYDHDWFNQHKDGVLAFLQARREAAIKAGLYQVNERRSCRFGDPRRGRDFSKACYSGKAWLDGQRVEVVDGIGTCPTCGKEQVFSDFTRCRVDDCQGWVRVTFGRGYCTTCRMVHVFTEKPTSDEPIDTSGPWLTWYESAAREMEGAAV
jgi:hypothetical protein